MATVALEHGQAPTPASNPPATAAKTDRLGAVEALSANVLARSAAQDREIAELKGTIAEMRLVQASMWNLHSRLDDLEAIAHWHEEGDKSEEETDDDDIHEEEDGEEHEGAWSDDD